jgi:hypothetical protein
LFVRPASAGLNANSTVFVILMENHNWADVKDSASAPLRRDGYRRRQLHHQ